MLVGCAQDGSSPFGGEKQSLGTIIGGVTGGLLGSRFGHGSGSIAATGAGVLVGAALGNYLGAKLDARDKEAASHAMTQALNQPSATPVAWNNTQSGNRGTIVAKPVHYETRAETSPPAVTPPPDNLVTVDPVWIAPSGAKLHAAPSTNAPTVGHLRAGRRFEVAGKLPDSDWLTVTQRGRPVGYVSTSVAKPAVAVASSRAPAATPPAPTSPTPSSSAETPSPTISPEPNTAPSPAPSVAPSEPSNEPVIASSHTAGKAGTSTSSGNPASQPEGQAENSAGSSTAAADPNAIVLGGTGHTARVACRTIVSTVNLQGQTQPEVTESKACQQPDGSWAPASS
jgi:surface antigen